MQAAETMTTQNSEVRHRQLLLGFAAAILLSTPGRAAVVSGSDSFRSMNVDLQMQVEAANQGRGNPIGMRCTECGVVASAGPLAKSGAGNGTAVTVRMADGSSRSFHDASPAKWRPGERVIVIN
ncbi:MAG: hypothetical protein KJ787_02155 [Gammaproteobacteria bacterium]|nr:hypothetical protein [Gammaproteobacteria bacterium]MBU1645119.1 hypothetical protein [Gammaproteobacteria bacterium]MBU1973356.1 hypothetical protein [Gammaproteobacteria bacterium]